MKPDTIMFPRWIKTALLLAVLALLSIGIWFYRFQQQTMQQKVEQDLSAIAQLKADQISAWRKDQLADAAALVENALFVQRTARFLADPSDDHAENLHKLFRLLAKQNDYTDILMVDPAGKILLSLSGDTRSHDIDTAALSTALRERMPVFIDLHIETQDPTPHISVVAPLFSDAEHTQKFYGAVILISNASRFLYPLIQSWPTPSKTAETLLVRRDGEVVLFLNELRHRSGTALKLRIPLSREDLPASMAISGRKGIVMGKDYRGVAVVSVIMPIPDSPWFMITKVDAAEVFADWRFRSALMLALLLGLTATIGATGLFLWYRGMTSHLRMLYLSEAALRATNERHSITLKSIGDAVIATDARGLVELLNPVAEVLTGWTDTEAHGVLLEEVFRIVNEETKEKVESPVAKVLRKGHIVGLANHTVLIRRDGTEVAIDDSGAPIKDESGNIIGVILVFRDITDHRLSEEALHKERDLLEAVMDATDVMLVYLDRDFNFIWVNAAYAATCNMSQKEMIGKNHFLLYPHEDNEAIFRRIRDTGEAIFFKDKPFEFPDQPERGVTYWDWSLTPVKRSGKEVTGLVFSLRETTKYKLAELELQKSEMEKSLILENANEIIAYHDRDRNLVWANKAYLNNVGLQLSQLKGEKCFTCWGVESLCNNCPITIAIETGKVHRARLTPENQPNWPADKGAWDITAAPAKDAAGNIIGVIEVARDVTEQTHSEQELRKARDELEIRVAERTTELRERNEQLARLSSQLTLSEQRERRRIAEVLHDDLQQWLVAAKIGQELMISNLDKTLKPQAERILDLINHALKGMRSLTTELAPSVLRSGDFSAALKWLAKWMHEKQHFEVQVQSDEQIILDRRDLTILLFQSIKELLLNVIKHAGVKSAELKIKRENESLRIIIKDRGVGFNPEIFSKNADSSKFGLISIRERLLHLGGRLEIESAPDTGSTISMVAPLGEGRPADEELPDMSRGTSRKSFLAPAGTQKFAEKIRVMLADDHPVMRSALAMMLNSNPDIEVVGEASDGQEAVHLVRELLPDIVLMDITMPNMDGIEATRMIHAEFPHMRVIGLSMYDADDKADLMLAAGASAYRSKSGKAGLLLDAIRGMGQ